MKKTYLQPTTTAVLVKMEACLATLSAGGETDKESDLLGGRQRRGDWDEE